MTTFRQYFENRMERDPEFRRIVEENEPDFQITRAIAGTRAKTGMTQKELSAKTGIMQSEISKMENGNGNPSLKTLKKLAAGMGMRLVISFEPIEQKNDKSEIPVEIEEPEYEMA